MLNRRERLLLYMCFALGISLLPREYPEQRAVSSSRVEDVAESPAGRLELLLDESGVSYEDAARAIAAPALGRLLDRRTLHEIISYAESPVMARAMIIAYSRRNTVARDGNNRLYSPQEVHTHRRPIDCTEAAQMAAALLADDGYRPVVLAVSGNSLKEGHWVFLYRMSGSLGYIDINRITEPRFAGISEIMQHISATLGREYTHYCLFDLDRISPGWMHSNAGMPASVRLTSKD